MAKKATVQEADQIRLLFFSKTTWDKRTTANTLLGDILFDVEANPGEVEKKEGNGFIIDDMPGIMDADVSPEKVKETIVNHRKKSIEYSAIVLVFRYPVRMTPEEIESIDIILGVTGKKLFKKFGIIIFTNCKSLKQNDKNPEEEFQSYLQSEIDQASSAKKTNKIEHFGHLIEWVSKEKCMFIDSEETKKEEVMEYVRQFTDIVKKVQAEQKNKKYSGLLMGKFDVLKG